MESVAIVLALVLFAVVVAVLAERFRTPAPSLLVIAGLLVALIPAVPPVQVSPDLIALVVLPPLLYAAAIDVSVPELRSVLRPVLALAVGLVLLTAAVVAVVLHLVSPQVTIASAFVLGAILASTDPVAVSALARRLRLPPRLLALVQGESLLNDATSLVLFRVAVGVVVAGGGVGVAAVLGQFLWLGGGGALIGLVLAYLVEQLRRRVEDPVLDTVLALLTPYVVYITAEALRSSGVTAVVVCGLLLSRRTQRLSTGPVRLQVQHVYAVIVFLLESVVFAIIGLEIPGLVERLQAEDQRFLLPAVIVTLAVIVTRAVWVFPTGWLRAARRSDSAAPAWRELAVISWAGTRGVVPLAAALSIPLVTDDGQPFPERDFLQVLAICTIALTLVVQGLTLEPVVRRLGVSQDQGDLRRQRAVARHAIAAAAVSRFGEIAEGSDEPPAVLERLRRDLEQRERRTQVRLDRMTGGAGAAAGSADAIASTGAAYRRLRLDVLAAESAELSRLRDSGEIGEEVRREVQRGLDLEEARLLDGGTS